LARAKGKDTAAQTIQTFTIDMAVLAWFIGRPLGSGWQAQSIKAVQADDSLS